MEKVNLEGGCNEISVLAKLMIIQLRYLRLTDELLSNKTAFHLFVNDQVVESFIYAESEFEKIKAHLSLFLLNNKNNSFSRLINE